VVLQSPRIPGLSTCKGTAAPHTSLRTIYNVGNSLHIISPARCPDDHNHKLQNLTP